MPCHDLNINTACKLSLGLQAACVFTVWSLQTLQSCLNADFAHEQLVHRTRFGHF